MPPKKPASTTGARPTKKNQSAKKEHTNPLGAAPPKICRSCEQSSHDHDRDMDQQREDAFVTWAKTTRSARGVLMPAGEECYRCFDVRRRFFGQPMSELTDLRATSKALDERFYELRRDRATGANRH